MNCDNCKIEVPCAEDCEQCKRRGENQESQEPTRAKYPPRPEFIKVKELAESNTNKQKLQRIADENFVERIAKMIGCLPSYFVGGNEHIIKQLEQLKAKLEAANKRAEKAEAEVDVAKDIF